MNISVNNFKLLYSEFEEVNEQKIELILDSSKDIASKRIFGKQYAKAVYLLTAHELKFEQEAAEGNEHLGKELTGSSFAGQSISFKASSDDEDNDYKSTVYGRQFLALRKRCSFAAAPIAF